MNISNCLRTTIALLLCCCSYVAAQTGAAPATAPSGREFSHPDRIRYDGQCMTIDGRDVFIYSGSFHYFRCPKPLWRDRFAKIKEAGFNAVETYAAWNWHEREMPADVNDFSKMDMTDLRDWLKMAIDEFGLYVIIRPGPYICAEWAGGGYPVWLASRRPKEIGPEQPWTRTDEPTYLAWSKHWYDACCKVIEPEQITRKPAGKPGVILFQIENEYDFAPGPNESQRMGQLKALYKDAIDNNIDVPIFTCWTRQTRSSKDPDLKNVFDAPNCYDRWGISGTAQKVDQAIREQPGAPGMIAELQGGWFSGVGGTLAQDQDGITAEQCNAITLMAMSHGATILNYYMVFGGTNIGDWGARGQTTSYDYFAPIRETGGVGAKYAQVWGIGHMLQQYGPAIARSKQVTCKTKDADSELSVVARRAQDGQMFLFVWNRSRQQPAKGDTTLLLGADDTPLKINVDLAPFGFKVLLLPKDATDSTAGKWLPEPMPTIQRPELPAPIKITQASVSVDPGPTRWVDLEDGRNLASYGIYDARPVMYRATVSLNAEQVEQFKTLRVEQEQPDSIIARVNGKIITGNEHGRREASILIGPALQAGENEIVILYENGGYPNWGRNVEDQAGVTSGELIHRKSPDVMITQWRSQLLEEPTTQPGQRTPYTGPTTQPDFDDAKWEQFKLDAQSAEEMAQPLQPGAQDKYAAGRILMGKRGSAVFRSSINVTQQMLDEGLTQLVFGRIDDRGIIYINGKQAGFARSANDPLAIDAKPFLQVGTNQIAVVVNNRDGDGGLLKPVRLVGTSVDRIPLKWQLATNLGGFEQGWQGVDGKGDTWKTVKIDPANKDAPPIPADAMAVWYRVEFELPQLPPGVWAPWLARISAAGNGMIYLNGQHLGRWWEVGPQKDFFLPECWLNSGAGKKNVLTFCLRRTDRGASLLGLEILPDAQAAERREAKTVSSAQPEGSR